MNTWLLIAALALGTVAFKIVGPLLAGGREPPRQLLRVVALLAPALIAALVVSDTFTAGQELVLDARAAGVGAGLIALLLRAPVVVALVLAVVVCALTRHLG